MKKVILGTTALVAASALTAGSASAAEKIKLNVGGYMQTSFVVADYDTGNQLASDVRYEGEVHFTGKTTLDNGLEFGVNIQLEARQSTDQVDETFVWVEGAFGRVNIGSEDSASYLMHYASPSPVPAWGVGGTPNANASGFALPSTLTNELGDTDKITYFTPRMGGFQLGASYTPDGDEETGTASPYSPIQDEGKADEAYSVGANYQGKFGGVSLKASLGYQLITRTGVDTVTAAVSTSTHVLTDGTRTLTNVYTDGSLSSSTYNATTVTALTTVTAVTVTTATAAATTATTSTEDTDEFAIGLGLGVAGFNIGAAYKFTDNDGGTDDLERHDYNIGVNYGQGPWKVGVQYSGIELDGASDGTQQQVVVGGQYILGPGVTAFGGVQFWDGEGDSVSATSGDNATVFFVGTHLSF